MTSSCRSGSDPALAGAILTIDLSAVADNWRSLSARAAPAACSAVVKADAYGLGAVPVTETLLKAGCTTFFVAHADEGITLRQALGSDFRIGVLNGTPPGTEAELLAHDLVPVVNSLPQLAGWRSHAARVGTVLPIFLQLDSGMSRLGLSPDDVASLAADPSLLQGLELALVMSHLACADEPDHPANAAQLAAFERLRALLPAAAASFANSSGIFLGGAYRFDMVRPGVALYGLNPTPHLPNPMRPVVRLEARVAQLRCVGAGAGIGYGHRARASSPMRLATLSVGYADGWPRSAMLSACHAGRHLPFTGTVSMDSLVVDVTDDKDLNEGDLVELIGQHQSPEQVAAAAGTIGYEILTRLGRRFHRRYVS